MHRLWLVGVAACAACATVDEEEAGPQTSLASLDENKTDASAAEDELYARVEGLSVWLDPVARRESRDGRTVHVLGGRASKNLSAAHAWVPDDAFCRAQTISARKFEVACEAGHELNTMLSGLPVFIDLEPVNGAAAHAAIWWGARFGALEGAGATPKPALHPILAGDELVYRGRVTVGVGRGGLTVETDGPPPAVSAEEGRTHRVDFSYDQLDAALPGAVRFVTSKPTLMERSARIGVRGVALGLTLLDPVSVWDHTCRPSVKACLQSLAPAADTEPCGAYRDVRACQLEE